MCIDDFALKKREKYGTVMVDIDTHRIIDMIESRDQATVIEWLKSYPNIKVIARDGSITYHSSITEAHPNAIQVSDRFHIYKNLTDYIIEYLKKHLKAVIEVVVDNTDINTHKEQQISKNNENRKLTQEEKYQKILLLQAENKNQTEICRAISMDVRCYKKLMAASNEERKEMFKTVATTRHEDKVSDKMKIVNEVRDFDSKGLSKQAISKKTGISYRTITKYLDYNFNPVHATYGKKKPGILNVFYNEIDELLRQGIMGSKIEALIRSKGYNGSSSTIRHYASEWKKRYNKDTSKDEVIAEEGKKKLAIKRNDIFRTLFKPLSDVKNLHEDIFQCFCEQYPFFSTMYGLVNSFKDIFQKKQPELLTAWIDKARNTKVREIISFTNGIERDYEAIKNAILLPFSNGLAEGCVNKIKVIKRIMYGRCSFETLKNKTIRLEKMRKFN